MDTTALSSLRLPRRSAPADRIKTATPRAAGKAVAKALAKRARHGRRDRTAIDDSRRDELLELAESLARGEWARAEEPESHGQLGQVLTDGFVSPLYLPLVRLWARQGPVFLQRATIAATTAALEASYENHAQPFRYAWSTLRALLSRATEDEWSSCRALAEDARADAPLPLRALIDGAYPDVPAWANDSARTLLASPGMPRWAHWALLSAVSDPDLPDPLVRIDLQIAFGHIGVHAADVLLCSGKHVVPVLLEVFAMSARGRSTWRWGVDSLVALANALACVDTPSVREALSKACRHDDFVPVFEAHSKRFVR